VSLVALVWLLAWPAASLAADPATATESLRATFTEANRIVTDPATAERPHDRLRAVRLLIGRAFDFAGAAEHALGSLWQGRSVSEQSEFRSLFASFVERGFVYWLASVAEVDDRKGGLTVRYLGESADRDSTVVHTALGRRGGRQIQLDHDMVYQDRRWMVRDVTIDGISLVTNYRAQFSRVVRASSYPDLLARLRAKVDQELPRPASAGAARSAPADLARPSLLEVP
jgi:phospholipid transport system substrate-binding protein